MKLTAFSVLCAAFVTVPIYADSCAAASNLVANCGFETGDFTSWTLSGHDSASGYNGIDYGVDAADAHSGSYGAYLGGFGGVLDLSQSISTTPGMEYTISFWLAQSPAPVAPYLNSFSASFGSVSLASLNQLPETPFTEYSFQGTASQTNSTLLLGFRNDLGYFSLDDVSVIQSLAVPEPEMGAAGAILLLAALVLTKQFQEVIQIFLHKIPRKS